MKKIPKESAEIVNLTPHDIKIISHRSFMYKDNIEPEVTLVIPPSGIVARSEHETILIKQLVYKDQVLDITSVFPNRVKDLPGPELGVYYAVSKIVAEQLKGRGDLLVMHGLYKKNGQTIGCRSFTLW